MLLNNFSGNAALVNKKFNIFKFIETVTLDLSLNYFNLYYNFVIKLNYWYINFILKHAVVVKNYYYLLNIFITFIKLNIVLLILYSFFFLTYFENYFKKIIYSNLLYKLTILNETEKEIGPIDDFLYFALLFILTISFFIFISINILLFHGKLYSLITMNFVLLALLFLTLPINLFFDYGISFVVYIRGSTSSTNLIKELVFDIISTFTIFIRFIIQNIRFFFILLAIFELLSWTLCNTDNNFLVKYSNNNNIFINSFNSLNSLDAKNYSVIFVNSILFIIFYCYYYIHLLFLLLTQIIVYFGISVWLFFFLYSTKFLSKYEKFFIIKKFKWLYQIYR